MIEIRALLIIVPSCFFVIWPLKNFLFFYGQTVFGDRKFYIKNKIKIENQNYFSFLYHETKKTCLILFLACLGGFVLFAGLEILLTYLFGEGLKTTKDFFIAISFSIVVWPLLILLFESLLVSALILVKKWSKMNKKFVQNYSNYYQKLLENSNDKIKINLDLLSNQNLIMKNDSKWLKRLPNFKYYFGLMKKLSKTFSSEEMIDFYFIQRWDYYKIAGEVIDFSQMNLYKKEMLDKYNTYFEM
ncbi:hypothetical protein [Metamycoplasma neophronis]|uniref:Uncharacterized protein n=1 Tax=Metamycoplasma neophronis TaxID=872983 RepID=A0ABY2Z1D9_9BACT|nr:hypothetical protein [Metamycoplasma neophronis]TPR54363.1 hypothetical protein FJR74_01140 [Metamycoplasma neophronis]